VLQPKEVNSAILVYYQSTFLTLKEECLLRLVDQCISSQFFDELRTRQQLGYVVTSKYKFER